MVSVLEARSPNPPSMFVSGYPAQSLSHVWLFMTRQTVALQAVLGDSPGKNTGVGCHFLLQGLSWPRGLLRLLHCWGYSLLLSHRGSPIFVRHPHTIPGPVCVTDRTAQKLQHVTSEPGLQKTTVAPFFGLLFSLSNGQLWGKPAASPRAAIWKAPRGEDLRPSSGNQRRELGRRPSCRGPKCWPQAWLKPRGRPGARSRHLRCSQTLREVTDSSCLKPLHFLAICSAALMHANRHCRAVVFVCFSSDL